MNNETLNNFGILDGGDPQEIIIGFEDIKRIEQKKKKALQ